ncbi:hypothetical protein [Peribacillus sp. SCS-155]|uniref:hypothetical protein n=1 Tax=Peribacillus sedimenti TaxID=3115297 RepID=UPI003906BAEA
MIIREAKLSDAAGIAKVHVDCWRTTHKNIFPCEFLFDLSYQQRTALCEKNINKTGNIVYVAEGKDGEVIGVADGKEKPMMLKSQVI